VLVTSSTWTPPPHCSGPCVADSSPDDAAGGMQDDLRLALQHKGSTGQLVLTAANQHSLWL